VRDLRTTVYTRFTPKTDVYREYIRMVSAWRRPQFLIHPHDVAIHSRIGHRRATHYDTTTHHHFHSCFQFYIYNGNGNTVELQQKSHAIHRILFRGLHHRQYRPPMLGTSGRIGTFLHSQCVYMRVERHHRLCRVHIVPFTLQ